MAGWSAKVEVTIWKQLHGWGHANPNRSRHPYRTRFALPIGSHRLDLRAPPLDLCRPCTGIYSLFTLRGRGIDYH